MQNKSPPIAVYLESGWYTTKDLRQLINQTPQAIGQMAGLQAADTPNLILPSGNGGKRRAPVKGKRRAHRAQATA